MITRVALLFAFLWYALVPTIGRLHASESPSLRSHRHDTPRAVVVGGTTTREGAREPRGHAPALAAEDATPIVAAASLVRKDVPSATNVVAPDSLPCVPVARGPPVG